MNKVTIPEFVSKAELFAFLRKDATKLIAQKKALPTISDNLEFGYSVTAPVKSFVGTKAKNDQQQDPVEGELPVELIANVSGWCDSSHGCDDQRQLE
jgi:hypothetical protein